MTLRNMVGRCAPAVAAAMGLLAMSCATAPPRAEIAGSPCAAPPRLNCPEANCPNDGRTVLGSATESKSGRKYWLDFPCDLKPGEDVTLVLNLHGAGSIGNWQRHYFPAVDHTSKYRLVVATPTALTDQPTRRWAAEADDDYLHSLTDALITDLGKENIKAFWLVGHSQGGLTSRRIVCSDYFRDKVDGFVSLSGGRVGTPPRPPAAPAPGAAPAPAAAPPPPLDCDFSHIFAIGELEASSATATDASEWAAKYDCGPRKRRADVVDVKAGYVTATDQSRGPAWGRFARPGTAQVYVFDGCKNGRVVADVVRMDKGHTEGLEPNITQDVIELMRSAKGGKLRGK